MSRRSTIFSIFFIQAVAGGSIFARIPDIQLQLGLSESELGLALMGGFIGGLFANLFAGRVVDKFGTRSPLVVGIPLLTLANSAVTLAPVGIYLFSVLFLTGALFSLTNVAMNVEADRLESDTGDRVMNRCHGYWSVGMLAAAGIGVLARQWGISPGLHLWSLSGPVIGLAMILTFPMSSVARDEAETPSRMISLPSRRTAVIVLFGLSAGVGQMAAQNWSVIFMRDSFSVAQWLETLVLPAYLLSLALGRIFADGAIKAIGAKPVASISSILAGLGCLMVAASPSAEIAVLGFATLGLGSAVHFPLMNTAASASATRSSAEAVSAAIMLAGVAMMFTPALMGYVAEFWGLRVAILAVIGPFALSLLLTPKVVR